MDPPEIVPYGTIIGGTVLQKLSYLAARLIGAGSRLTPRFGKHCLGYRAFEALYYRLLTLKYFVIAL